MKDLATHEKFIELRANNESYLTIAKKLGVSKTTLMQWAKNYKTDTANARNMSLDALQAQYGVSKQERITLLGEQLQAIRSELQKRGLSDVPTFRLLEMLTKLTDYLCKEEVPVVFTKEHADMYLEPIVDIEQWGG